MIKYIRDKQYPWIRKALKRDNYKCRQCNSNRGLIVHHIDEDRKNGWYTMNNKLSNLMTLCKSCHAYIHNLHLKFSRPDKYLIKELRDQNKTYEEIGDYLGISRQRVHQIMNGYITSKGIPKIGLV